MSGLRWVVDPLDGTVNFLFGIPLWCVSIACETRSGALAGVVFDPMRGETWAATERVGDARRRADPGARARRAEHRRHRDWLGYAAVVRESQARVVVRLLPRVATCGGSAPWRWTWPGPPARRFDADYERGVKHWDEWPASSSASAPGW